MIPTIPYNYAAPSVGSLEGYIRNRVNLLAWIGVREVIYKEINHVIIRSLTSTVTMPVISVSRIQLRKL